MLIGSIREPILAGLIFAGLSGTSPALSLQPTCQLSPLTLERTSSGEAVRTTASSGAAIAELRRLTGLTWDQLARLFKVSRRAVHFWASGKPMTAANEEHLHRLLAVIRRIDRGSASANRSAIFAERNGEMAVDLLARGHYDEVLLILGEQLTSRRSPTKPPTALLAERAPLPPELLVAALNDRVLPTSGRLLSAQPLRIPRRK